MLGQSRIPKVEPIFFFLEIDILGRLLNSFRPHSKTISSQIEGQIMKNESNERMSGGRRTPKLKPKWTQEQVFSEISFHRE